MFSYYREKGFFKSDNALLRAELPYTIISGPNGHIGCGNQLVDLRVIVRFQKFSKTSFSKKILKANFRHEKHKINWTRAIAT